MTVKVPFTFARPMIGLPEEVRRALYRDFSELGSAFDNLPSVFVVVADDGSGDFLSIKDAIEAQPSATSNEAAPAIWVKPGTYNDNGAGLVNVADRRIYLFAASGATRASSAKQTWTFDGFTTTLTGSLSFTGFDLVTGSIESWINGSGTIHLRLVSCTGSGRGIVGPGFANLEIIDCRLDALLILSNNSGNTLLSLRAYNSDIALASAASAPVTQSNCNQIEVVGGTLGHSAALAISNSGGSGGLMLLNGTFLSGGGSITSAFDDVAVLGCTTDEDTTAVDFVVDGISGSRFALVTFAGNAMHGCDLTFGNNCRVSVHGAYRKLTIGSTAGSYFVEVDTVSADVALQFANTSSGGDDNFVVAAVRTPGGGGSQVVNIPINCNENVVLYTVNGTPALSDTDAGSANRINVFPPSGAAGGDLSGTYPDPAVVDDSHLHSAATVTLDLGDLTDVEDAMTPGAGDVLTFDGAEWDAAAPAASGVNSFSDTTVGDGASTSIAINHALGTEAVVVSVVQNSDDLEVYPDVTITDANNVTLGFTVAPALNALRVTVLG